MLLEHHYTYRAALEASLKVNWQVHDLIGNDKPLNFHYPFLPEALAQVQALTFLSPEEQRLLNQIRGHSYLHLFGLVEEFILPFVLDHVRSHQLGDDYQTRSLLQFAQEEAKHIHLFKEFAKAFEAGFGTSCGVIGPAADFAQAVLAKSPLGVVLIILHIEWMTQRHYLDSVRNNHHLDPQFASLLKHHWLEEAQHAKLDTLMAETLAAESTPAQIAQGLADYGAIVEMIDQGLQQQVELDRLSLENAMGRLLTTPEKALLSNRQLRAYRYTFLISGMTHPHFITTLEKIAPEGLAQVTALIQGLEN
ncbi:hypothetical protein [Synechocystis sp. LKSZ1]|uniref:hypothetical protein n=1 Tax=Synechocystis sp. LKSZ1 TaxID=3144951 RepID=UPI00336BCC46